MSDPQLLRSMLAKHSALQLNIDAAQRELDRRNAEGEDVGAYRVCQETGRIVKCAKAEAIANANAHLYNAGLPAYGELAAALRGMAEWAALMDAPGSLAPLDREGRAHRTLASALLSRIPS